MKLNPEDKSCLEGLSLHYAIPTDQLRRNPVVLGRIRATFNRMTSHDADATDLLRYMINRRKSKEWPTLGDRAKRFPPALAEIREICGTDVVVKVYKRRGIALDEYLCTASLAREFSHEVSVAAGRAIAPATLVAGAMALRKRGLLPRVASEQAQTKSRKPAGRFSDIGEVDRQFKRRHSSS